MPRDKLPEKAGQPAEPQEHTLAECPRCHCAEDGTKLYRCTKCQTVFCESCGTNEWVRRLDWVPPKALMLQCPECVPAQHDHSSSKLWGPRAYTPCGVVRAPDRGQS